MNINRRLHPLIQLISLIVVIAGVALNIDSLIAATVILILGYVVTSFDHLRPGLRLIKQLRWLFLSIIILFFWFTPGEPVFSDVPYSPSIPGLVFGFQRITSLLLIVLYVNLYLSVNSIDTITSALILLTKPFSVLGFPSERFAVRIALVFTLINKMESLFQEVKNTTNTKKYGKIPIITVAKSVGLLYSKTITYAEREPLSPIKLNLLNFPNAIDWSFPIVLSILFWNL